jgi:hypothetical protein
MKELFAGIFSLDPIREGVGISRSGERVTICLSDMAGVMDAGGTGVP